MVGLVSMIAIMLIFSAQGYQLWADKLRRENEAEMMFRAQEIARAIFKFQQANGRLPNKLDELMEAGPKGEYFLRRMYDDPLVPEGKWGLLYGGPGGQVVDPSRDRVGYGEELGNVSSADTQTVGGLQSGFGDGPQEIGGLPIVGVKTLCEDQPFRVYNGLTDYSEWLFTIYDLQNLQVPGQGKRPGGQPGAGRPGGRQGVGRPGGGTGNRSRSGGFANRDRNN
jgi:hypothetical protein